MSMSKTPNSVDDFPVLAGEIAPPLNTDPERMAFDISILQMQMQEVQKCIEEMSRRIERKSSDG